MSEFAKRAALYREDHLGADVPDDVADKVFAYAYQQGHANGWHEVEGYYMDVAALVTLAYRAGAGAA